ncbi:MAG: S-methyl-5-thioribose-1-phosphate isomerase [Gemmatimonadota bacterium]
MPVPTPIAWTPDHRIRILDQTLLPSEERYLELDSVDAMVEAIQMLRVRGAPLIGIAGAMGVTLAARGGKGSAPEMRDRVRHAAETLRRARPTAVNLAWAVDRMWRRAAAHPSAGDLHAALLAEASAIWEEDRQMCERIGFAGQPLLRTGVSVMTQCNAGILATGGLGTALAPIYCAHRSGLEVQVVVPETRPLLQGARLTAWELMQSGVPCTLITDGMVASRMRRGDIHCAIVGADRIAANGDVANKIGTYGVALAARAHGVPLYVAAPRTTFDFATPTGREIPIEERSPEEVRGFGDTRSGPEDVPTWNPAFDVTPSELIAGYITDAGVLKAGEFDRLR